jgi:hypothetical protein
MEFSRLLLSLLSESLEAYINGLQIVIGDRRKSAKKSYSTLLPRPGSLVKRPVENWLNTCTVVSYLGKQTCLIFVSLSDIKSKRLAHRV